MLSPVLFGSGTSVCVVGIGGMVLTEDFSGERVSLEVGTGFLSDGFGSLD